MKAQRDIAHANDTSSTLVLIIHIGNAGIAESTLSIGGHFILDGKKRKRKFRDSFHFNMGTVETIGSREIIVTSEIAPNPAIEDKTLMLTYDVSNVEFFTNKKKTLTAQPINGSEIFQVSLIIL